MDTVSSDRSIADATNFQATAVPLGKNVVEAARAQMPLMEHEYWEAFLQRSVRLPDVDWSVDREDKPTSKKPFKRARRRAEALNRLYGTDQARPSHSVWFVKNHIEYLPLVKAMARVIGMEKQMGFDRSSRGDALDLADLHTTRSVISTLLKVKRDHETAFQAWKRDVNAMIQAGPIKWYSKVPGFDVRRRMTGTLAPKRTTTMSPSAVG